MLLLQQYVPSHHRSFPENPHEFWKSSLSHPVLTDTGSCHCRLLLYPKSISTQLGNVLVRYRLPLLIDEHYNEPLSLDHLADTFYVNKYTLSRMFKRQPMLTVYEYITMKRINSAKLKIQKGTPPSQVYLEVGFNDYSTFYRVFK